MGYYSQVALCVSEKVEIPEYLQTTMESIWFNLVSTSQGSRLYGCDCLKWYDSYQEIEYLERFMNSLNYEDYLFIRIGEKFDDTEYRGGFFDNPFEFRVERRFCYNVNP